MEKREKARKEQKSIRYFEKSIDAFRAAKRRRVSSLFSSIISLEKIAGKNEEKGKQ